MSSSPDLLRLLCACVEGSQTRLTTDGLYGILEADPLQLASVAGRHLVTPHLAAWLECAGMLWHVDPAFSEYLSFIRQSNTARNNALRTQLGGIAVVLNTRSITPVLLKGTARLVDGLYADMTVRFMRDLDILVPADRGKETLQLLHQYGYNRANPANHNNHRHYPPLRKEGEAGIVEVHTEVIADSGALPGRDVIERSRLIELTEARVLLPNLIDQIAIIAGQDQVDRYMLRAGSFVLRNVFELALLVEAAGLSSYPSFAVKRHSRIPFALAARLFPDHVRSWPLESLTMRLWVKALLALEAWDGDHKFRDRIDMIPGQRRVLKTLRMGGAAG